MRESATGANTDSEDEENDEEEEGDCWRIARCFALHERFLFLLRFDLLVIIAAAASGLTSFSASAVTVEAPEAAATPAAGAKTEVAPLANQQADTKVGIRQEEEVILIITAEG